MTDTKRTILAFVISFVILMGWFAFFGPKKDAEPAPAQAAANQTAAQPAGGAVEATPSLATAQTLSPAPAAATVEERVALKNSLVEVALTNRGARVERVALAKFSEKAGGAGGSLALMGKPGEGAGFTKLGDHGLKPTSMFSVAEKSDTRAVFTYKTPDGLRVDKIYTLSPDRYDFDLVVRVTNEGGAPVRDRMSAFLVGDFSAGSSRYIFRGPAHSQKGSYKEGDAEKPQDTNNISGNIDWTGVVENYFLWALVPKDAATATTYAEFEGDAKGVVRVGVTSPVFDLAPGQSAASEYRFFVGPKSKDDLAASSPALDNALYFGWFTVIASPLLAFLKILYGMVGNYGFAIILLTLFIKVLFWPLSAKSYKSMARMKELQPKIDKLKEKYGDDREKLNSEMMQLWKTHKVNPFSGCLPILVQIPVFIALYNVLNHSIEIRHAPFILYIHDMSAPDPYYITPILMGLSMFLQQKMTPATGMGEGQAKFMLYGMPILFTWLFHDFASGLVLYWLMNNVFSIGQQALMMRTGSKAKTA